MLNTGQLLILGIIIPLGYVLLRTSRHDTQEPPLVHNGIPVLGHILGMIQSGGDYWGKQACVLFPLQPRVQERQPRTDHPQQQETSYVSNHYTRSTVHQILCHQLARIDAASPTQPQDHQF